MKGMGVIDNNYNIKKDFLRKDVWEMKDTRANEHLSDSVWRNKLSQYWVDCAEMSEAIPEQVLDNCPISRMFGPMARTMKFMMCKKEVTEKMCGMAQAEKLQRRYHPNCLGANGALKDARGLHRQIHQEGNQRRTLNHITNIVM